MRINAEVRDIIRRVVNRKICENKLLSWSEIECEPTDLNLNSNVNQTGNLKKLICLIMRPRLRQTTLKTMLQGYSKMEWVTSTVTQKDYDQMMLKQYHLKDEEIPPREYKLILEDFIFTKEELANI